MKKSLTFIKQILLLPSNAKFLLHLASHGKMLGSDLMDKHLSPKDLRLLEYMNYVAKDETAGGTYYKLTERGQAIAEVMQKFLHVVEQNLPGEKRKDER